MIKDKQTKESIQRKHKKGKLKKLRKMGMAEKIGTITKRWMSCPPLSYIWNWMKEWMDLHVGWNISDDMYCNKILVPCKCAHAPNDILNDCLKSAVCRSCALGKGSKSESKRKYNW